MKIPEYQESVNIQAPKTNPLQVKTPEIPNVVPGAFGEDVAKATENLGAVGMKMSNTIMDHVIKQKELDNKILKLSATNKADKSITERFYDPTEEEYGDPDPISGKKKIRMKGIMMQVGEQNDNGYNESQLITSDVAAKIAATMPERVGKEWLAEYAPKAGAFHENALKYQSSQVKLGKAKEVDASIYELNKSMTLADTPEKMQAGVDEARKLATYKSDLYGDTIGRTKTLDDTVAMAVESGISAYLKRTKGDIAGAEGMLAKLNLPEITNTYIQGKIQTLGKQEINRAEFEKKQNDLKNQADAIIDVAEGKDSFLNPSLALQEKALNDPKGLGEILARVKASTEKTGAPSDYTDDYQVEDKNAGYLGIVKDLSSAKSLPELVEKGVKAITDNPDMDVDQKAAIAYMIAQKKDRIEKRTAKVNESIAYYKEQNYPHPVRDSIQKDPEQAAIDAGYKSVIDWADKSIQSEQIKNEAIFTYQKALQQNKKPSVAYNEAIKSAIALQYPELMVHLNGEDIPNGFVTSTGKATILLPKESKVESHKIWNPTTFKFETNPNRKVKSETTK